MTAYLTQILSSQRAIAERPRGSVVQLDGARHECEADAEATVLFERAVDLRECAAGPGRYAYPATQVLPQTNQR